MSKASGLRWTLALAGAAMLLALGLACAGQAEPKVVEVIKEVVVEREVVKEVQVPGETVVVEKEVVKEVQVPGETVIVEKEVVKTVEVPKEVVVEKEVVKTVAGAERVILQEVEAADPALTPQYGGTGILLMNDWLNLDPYRYEYYSNWVASHWAEKLIIGDWAIDREIFDFTSGNITADVAVGHLAESYELGPDLRAINLKIRDNVFWHDKEPTHGRQLTADDIIWNITGWWKESELIDRQYSSLIDTVDKISDSEIRLNLNVPVVGEVLTGILAHQHHLIVPWEIRETESGEVEDWRMVSGTGPFIMSELIPDSKVEMERNPNYWDFDEKHLENQLPYYDGMKLLIIPDESARFAAWRTRKADRLGGIPLAKVGSLLVANPDAHSKTRNFATMLALRMRWDLPPFNDKRMRQAVSMAINRQEIVDSHYEGQGEYYGPLLQPRHGKGLFTSFDDLPDDIQVQMTYNPEKARQLLAEAGYPDGLTVDLNVGPDTPMRDMAVIVQGYLKDIGITAEIIGDEWPEFNAIRYGKKHRHLIVHWNYFTPDPTLLFQWFTCDTESNKELGMNSYPECLHKFGLSGVNDPEFDTLYNDVVTELDDEKRIRKLREMEIYQLRDIFYATLPAGSVVDIWHNWVGGFQGEVTLGSHSFGALSARIWNVPENR